MRAPTHQLPEDSSMRAGRDGLHKSNHSTLEWERTGCLVISIIYGAVVLDKDNPEDLTQWSRTWTLMPGRPE